MSAASDPETSPRRVIVATGNAHKLEEIRSILDHEGGLDVELVSMREFDLEEPIEDGETFEANALIKARACAETTGSLALADDSGLEVDALDGAPGVYSARYAGEPRDDARNNAKLVAELANVPMEQRTARFVCAAAVVHPDGREVVVRGSIDGRIVDDARGENGFGYDPHFLVSDPSAQGRTTAQLAPSEKDAISHRGVAFRTLLPQLRDLLT